MAEKQAKCPDCGRYYLCAPGVTRCSACTPAWLARVDAIHDAVEQRGCRTVEEVAAATGMEAEDVLAICRESPTLARRVDTGVPCARCQKRPAQTGARYCLDCRLFMNSSITEAVNQLRDIVASTPKEYISPLGDRAHNIRAAMEQKRDRTASSRIEPSPKNRYSR